jgi:hypothetical protein
MILSCNNFSLDKAAPTPSQEYEVEVEFVASAVESPMIYTPILGGSWSSSPNIEICEDSPISARRIIKELKWWSRLTPSYSYNELIISDCDYPIESGWIRFTVADPSLLESNGWSAYAYTDFNRDWSINYSRVSLNELNNKWIIRHEIGHAFGWDHVPEKQEGHLMNTHVGCNIEGLSSYRIRDRNEKKN